MDGALSGILYWVNSNISVSSEQKTLQRYKNLYFHMFFYKIYMCFLLQKNEKNRIYIYIYICIIFKNTYEVDKKVISLF